MPQIEVTTEIDAPAQVVYALVSDTEGLVNLFPDADRITVRERGDGWAISAWEGRLRGRRVRWVERDTFDPENFTVEYQQIEGDLKVMEGVWRCIPLDAQRTRLELTVHFEFGLPMLEKVLNPIGKVVVRENCEQMVAAIKQAAKDAAPSPD